MVIFYDDTKKDDCVTQFPRLGSPVKNEPKLTAGLGVCSEQLLKFGEAYELSADGPLLIFPATVDAVDTIRLAPLRLTAG